MRGTLNRFHRRRISRYLFSSGVAVMFFSMMQLNAQAAPEWQVIGWNDLGMHCMDGMDFSVFSILPPYNTIHAHVIHNGELVTSVPAGITVSYQAVADPSGSINKTTADKVNFWEHVADMFGAQPADDTGLTGNAMPGTNNIPQEMEFESAQNWFTGEGIPLSPFDDAGNVNYYPMMKIVVKNGSTVVAQTDIVLPVSDEMTCEACHQSGSQAAARPAQGWRWHPDQEKDLKYNILRLHDDRQLGKALFNQALINQGYNTNGLYATSIYDGISILCARCHGSNALPGLGEPGVPPLTQVIHGHHAGVIDPLNGMTLESSANRDSCYRCHPGSATRCLRGAMGAAVAADGSLAIQCQSCHGAMSDVGSAARAGWFEEPKCQSCHTGTATDNNGQIRYTTVFDGSAERVAVNQTFATSPDTPAAGLSMYRFSAGHHNLQCSACHGSTHAIYPSAHGSDNIQNAALQGHEGTVVECGSCHEAHKNTFLGGPHGMHPVGNTDFAVKRDANERWFHGKAKEDFGPGLASCKACHGNDYKGTILSRSHADRTINTGDFGTKHFWRGYQIGCYTCHLGPNSENKNTAVPANVTSTSASTTANTPKVIALSTTKGTIRIVSQPQNGTVGLSGSTATYYPFFNFTGTDTFTYAAWDNASGKDSNLATGTVTVTEGVCELSCGAAVPTNAPSRNPVPFWAQAVVSNCAATASYAWNFGDGGTSTDALATHAYPTNGTYGWQVIASAAGQSCTKTGSIVITDVQIDTDGDGIEDDWEGINFGSLDVADGTTDFDNDGLTDLEESLAGTGPKDPSSRLVITQLDPPASPAVITWASEADRSYRVSATTSLVSTAFAPIAINQTATPPENSYTDPAAAGQPKKFYRIELE